MVEVRLQRGQDTLSPTRATGWLSMVQVGSAEMTAPPCDVRSPSTMKPMIAIRDEVPAGWQYVAAPTYDGIVQWVCLPEHCQLLQAILRFGTADKRSTFCAFCLTRPSAPLYR